nr:hypothetical protein [Tanacetum cinerariifolium]
MATTIEQQVALDEALVPSTQRLRIGRSNFRLPSDIQSKESTLQLVYDVLCRCPFFKAFLMNTKKHIVDMESIKEMLHICPRIPGQAFAELPFEEEILKFIWFLGHGATIRTLTDININKLYQPWRSFAAIINKCLTGKCSGYDNFVYQVKHKNQKKSNEMYYPRFTKVVSRHQKTQQYGAMLPIELTNDEIRNTKAYKEYYACATREAAPKPKASAKRKRSGSDTSITPPTATTTPTTTVAVTLRLTIAAKGKQPAKAKSPSDPSEVSDDEGDEGKDSEEGEEDDDDDDDDDDEDKNGEERDDDDQDQEVVKHDDKYDTEESEEVDEEGDGEEDQGVRISEEERLNEKEEAEELYKDVNINQGRGIQATLDVEDSHVILTLVHPDGQQESSSVSSYFVTSMLNPPSDASMESIFVTASSLVAPLQTTTLIMTPSNIATITTISHAPIPPTTIPSEVLQNLPTFDSVFRFEDRLKLLEANFSEYIQTNPFAKASVNAQLEAEVLTRSSHSSRTSYAVAADLSEMELKKILIEKMEGNKKKDPPLDQIGGLRDGDKVSSSESAFKEEPVQTTSQMVEPSYSVFETGSTQTWISELAKQADSRSSFNKLLDTPLDFSHFIMNRLRVDTLTLELLAGPTFELMKGSCTSVIELEYHLEEVYKATMDQLDWVNPEGQQYPHNPLQPLPLIPDNQGRCVIPFAHFINNDLEYLRGGASSCKYITSVTKIKEAYYGNIKWIEDLFYGFAVNRESALDVYSKRRIIAVTDLKIVEWHGYKHLDWITVHRDDDKLYKFKEGDFKSMFTRSIVIQRRVEDLQLGVESYQKRLNLTKTDTYQSDLKRREAYTAYSNPKGFIYQNKDKKNMLMRIDEFYKFSDGTLNDVRNSLDDRLKGIRI